MKRMIDRTEKRTLYIQNRDRRVKVIITENRHLRSKILSKKMWKRLSDSIRKQIEKEASLKDRLNNN